MYGANAEWAPATRSRSSTKPTFELQNSFGTRSTTFFSGALTSSESHRNMSFGGRETSLSPSAMSPSASSDQPKFGLYVMRTLSCICPPR